MKPSIIYNDLTSYIQKGLYSFEVASKQDHGYTLTGVLNTNIFLPNENIDSKTSYEVGQVIKGVVTKSSSRIVTISTQEETIRKSTIKPNSIYIYTLYYYIVETIITYQNLYPSFKFIATVLSVKDNIITLNLPGNHVGKAHYFHALSLNPHELEIIKPDETYKVRIIYIDHRYIFILLLYILYSEHLLFVSLRKHIRLLKPYKHELEFGTVIEKAKVELIDSYMGCVLNLNPKTTTKSTTESSDMEEEEDGENEEEENDKKENNSVIYGYCKRTNASDTPVSKMEKVVEKGLEYRCRIIGYNQFDGLIQVTLAPSLIDSKILSISNLSCDMPLTVSIVKITQKGLLCSIAPHV